jgi:cadmium resistance protein CadD (predicted permease)
MSANIYTAQRLADIKDIGEIVEKFNRWIMAVVYIALGIKEVGLIPTSFIFGREHLLHS